MATIVSAMLANWMYIGRAVLASIRANVGAIAAELERRLPPGEALKIREFHLRKAEMLEQKLEALAAADQALIHERGDDAAVKKALLDAIDNLRSRVIRTRASIMAAYGPEMVAKYGLSGETPDNTDALVQYASSAQAALENKPLPEPEESDEGEGIILDGARLAFRLGQDRDMLKTAQNAVARELREEQAALAARNRAMDEVKETYIGVADGFAADAFLAGYREVADRVRPTARRREGKPEPTDLDPTQQ